MMVMSNKQMRNDNQSGQPQRKNCDIFKPFAHNRKLFSLVKPDKYSEYISFSSGDNALQHKCATLLVIGTAIQHKLT